MFGEFFGVHETAFGADSKEVAQTPNNKTELTVGCGPMCPPKEKIIISRYL